MRRMLDFLVWVVMLSCAFWFLSIYFNKVGIADVKKGAATFKSITTENGFFGPGSVPIGGMVAVMPTIDEATWQPPATGVIKDGFMRADGHQITAQNVSAGSKIPEGVYLPNMVSMVARGGTTSCNGGIACQSKTGGNDSYTLTMNNVPQHNHSLTGSVAGGTASLTGSVAGGTASLTGNIGADNITTDRTVSVVDYGSGTATTANVSPNGHTHTNYAHYHDFSVVGNTADLDSTLGLSGSAPSLTGTTSFAPVSHSHTVYKHYHSPDGGSNATTDDLGVTIDIPAYTGSTVSYVSRGTWTLNWGNFPSTGSWTMGQQDFVGAASPSADQPYSVAVSHNHDHALFHEYDFTGYAGCHGYSGCVNGDTDQATSNNTSSASVGISGGSYSLTGSNDVDGSIGFKPATGAISGNIDQNTSANSGSAVAAYTNIAHGHTASMSAATFEHSHSNGTLAVENTPASNGTLGVSNTPANNGTLSVANAGQASPTAVDTLPNYQQVVWVIRVY